MHVCDLPTSHPAEPDGRARKEGAHLGRLLRADNPFESTLGDDWRNAHPASRHTVNEFKAALTSGNLPEVAFVDSLENINDEHPAADVQVGEAWTRTIYEAILKSAIWPTTALIWTYDEGGGFADHVPPPKTCAPSPAEVAFTELGVRVPMVIISPYARRHYVSHVVHEHTSITRFIETVFDLPALTARDANSDALLDMFDFACPPIPPSPMHPQRARRAASRLFGRAATLFCAPPQRGSERRWFYRARRCFYGSSPRRTAPSFFDWPTQAATCITPGLLLRSTRRLLVSSFAERVTASRVCSSASEKQRPSRG